MQENCSTERSRERQEREGSNGGLLAVRRSVRKTDVHGRRQKSILLSIMRDQSTMEDQAASVGI